MIENAHKHLERLQPGQSRSEAIVAAAVEVGPALFFSLLVITVSFFPADLHARGAGGPDVQAAGLDQEPVDGGGGVAVGHAGAGVDAPVPCAGRILPERRNPVNRVLIWLYTGRPSTWCWRASPAHRSPWRWRCWPSTAWPAMRSGSEFMPALDEGTLFYMPTTLPGLSINQVGRAAADPGQDHPIIPRSGVGLRQGRPRRHRHRSAPLEMFETVINLKPKDQWRAGMNVDSLIAELDRALQFPA